MKSRRVGFLGFEGVMALDLVGPIDAFTSARISGADGVPRPCYEIVIIGLDQKCFASESGVLFKPHTTLRRAPALDTLIIPGGPGLRNPKTQAIVAEWVKSRAAKIRRIASVCTGLYGLARTGLLDGRRVTTHWRYARDVAQQFPQLTVDPNILHCQDGPFYTSAGVTSGIDLALALIEEDCGPSVALAVARELVVYLKRAGGQEQYSEPLKFQTQSKDRFGDLAAWMQGHLEGDLSVETLARRARLCPRHFSRRFKDAFGASPARFVEDLRLGEARERLCLPDQTVELVARSVGFNGPDAFRRAFERRFGINPTTYRQRFDLRGLRRKAN
ncbi:MAG TPA: GlxA family transcriptional regulator [Planctomycetaceae bacterium]|nr:GlxA family transcriptional regulator [Planctomycetaceae bacterium]